MSEEKDRDGATSRIERILEKHYSEFGPYFHDLAKKIESVMGGFIPQDLSEDIDYIATKVRDKLNEKDQEIVRLEFELAKKQE